MKRSTRVCCLVNVFLLVSALHGSAPEITTVQVTRAGNRVVISFGVSKPTDVEVAVVDEKGKTVRHLAAGVIGRGVPVRPLKGGLSITKSRKILDREP